MRGVAVCELECAVGADEELFLFSPAFFVLCFFCLWWRFIFFFFGRIIFHFRGWIGSPSNFRRKCARKKWGRFESRRRICTTSGSKTCLTLFYNNNKVNTR